MQLNTAKQKMLQGQPAYGYSLGLGSLLAAELLARCGPTPQNARQRAEHGFQFLTAGSDAGFLLGGARAGLPILGL